MSKDGTASGGRFRPGKSGDPAGRPRKVPEVRGSAFDIIIERTLTITRNGQAREVTIKEALEHRNYQDALAGKRLAQREVLKWIKKREAWIAQQTRPAIRPIERWISRDPVNAITALVILGIATPDDNISKHGPADRYRRAHLEPWAVQAGLDRRRSATPLTEREVAEILRCTRDGPALRWPGRTRA